MRKIAAKRLRKFAHAVVDGMKKKVVTRRQMYRGLKKRWAVASQANRAQMAAEAESYMGLRG